MCILSIYDEKLKSVYIVFLKNPNKLLCIWPMFLNLIQICSKFSSLKESASVGPFCALRFTEIALNRCFWKCAGFLKANIKASALQRFVLLRFKRAFNNTTTMLVNIWQGLLFLFRMKNKLKLQNAK